MASVITIILLDGFLFPLISSHTMQDKIKKRIFKEETGRRTPGNAEEMNCEASGCDPNIVEIILQQLNKCC